MTNKQRSKVRFVRCPKCTKILPEPEHIPLYACGGCGAILQAKNYKGPETYTALGSHEQDVLQRNGINHVCYAGESSGSSRRSSSDHSTAPEERRSSNGVESSRISEQNGAANSPEDTSLSKNQENRETNNSKYDHNGSANHALHTTLSKESGCAENKENGETYRQIDQFDSKDRGGNDHSSLLEEHWKLTGDDSAVKDDNGKDEECNGIVIEKLDQKHIGGVNGDRERFTQDESLEDDEEDEHEEKLVRHVKAAKDASSLTESAAFKKNPAEHHASDLELSERTWKMHIEGKHTHDDRNEQNQIGNMLSGKDASSLTKSPSIEKLTQFASKKHAETDALRNENNLHELDEPEVAKPGTEYGNGTAPMDDASSLTQSPELTQLDSEIPGKHFAFDHEVSKEESKLQFVEVHAQQETSGNDINLLDADGAVIEKPSKEDSSVIGPYAIAEQLESVQITSTPSLSTFTKGGNDESVSVYTPPSVTDLKTFNEMATTKVSEDRLPKISVNNVKGMSKQNIENVEETSVYRDRKAGTLLKEIPESSSKRSPAYDGSVSSFDGNDDKVAEQLPQAGEQTLSPNNAVAGSAGAEESPEWDSLPSERMIFGNVRPSRQARGSSSTILDDKFRRRMIEEEGPLERNGIPRRFKLNSENFLPRGSNRRRSSGITYETGSTSSHALHDEPPRHRMHPHHPYGRRFPESSLWREKDFPPMCYNSETSGEYYDRPKPNSYMDRRRRTESWSQSGTLPRNPYSGEMFSGRYPYMHRYPEDRRWSAQLPPPAIYFHQGGYMNPNWETRWDPYDSYPTSPQHFMESEASYAWPHDTASLSDDPRHKDQIMRQIYLREKRQAVKTPFRPIAGGTPFITCYFCFHILQLPEDFLSRRRRQRRIHKLKCGACSSVLEFSLENEGGLAPCETNLNRNVNLAMSSHSHVNHSRHSSVSSADSRILLSRDSFGASNRAKRMSRAESLSKGENMEEQHDDDNDDDAPPSRGRSSKVTWKIPSRSKSPLHKLMGYSSPKEMLVYHEADD